MADPVVAEPAAPAPAAPAPVGNVNVNAGEPPAPAASANWYDDLEPDYKANPNLTKYKSKSELARAHLELVKTLGQPKVAIPTEKSTPEEWKAFFKAGGAPENEDEYDIGMEDLPEAIRTKAEALAEFRKAALANGVSKKQFDAMFGSFKKLQNQSFNQQLEEINKMRETTETALRSEWGAAYEAKVDGAQKVINTFFKDKNVRKEFNVLANDKGFVLAMAEIADRLGEDVIAGKPRVTMTPTEAATEYNRMLGDRKSPLFDDLHPEHAAYQEKFESLAKMMHAGS